MASRFPGVDPFIESQAWETFHAAMIAALMEALTLRVRPNYVVRVEDRVYLESGSAEQPPFIRPDVAIAESVAPSRQDPKAASSLVQPVLRTVPMPMTVRERFLTLRRRDGLEVVSIIEVLSPANKRRGSTGQREYLAKRDAVLQSPTHLVEIDLLRGGDRLPTVEPLPAGDSFVLVCRGDRRPSAEVYAWSLQVPLPLIPVPLSHQDPDVTIDLQALFDTVYERAGYDYSLDYSVSIQPPPTAAEANWIHAITGAKS